MKLLKIFLGLLCLLFAASSGAAERYGAEYDLKAVFLERFARFVDWPESALPVKGDTPFIIATIGSDPFDGTLQRYFEKRTVKGRPVRIVHFRTINEIGHCHILFIPTSMRTDLKLIIAHVENRPLLTVGDTEGYGEHGVHINFFLDDNRIRFEINPQAVQVAGLKMSYHLLQLAKLVTSREGG